ncbi:MAG: dephospho-CoA kinase [Candidatus Eiseniibacteriota bacterium]|nr:MAG: dephospho-CoA kinase [Candidatus Eisenbacteria bacterium]
MRPIDDRILTVGVTGGIASGKSSVCRVFERLGARVIDADGIGRDIVEQRDGVLSSLVSTFGEGILDPGGRLDRRKLAGIVFSNAESLERLNRIVHPFLIEEIRSGIEKASREGFRGVVAVDAALIFEWNLVEMFDAIVVVSCNERTQVARMHQRDLLKADEALSRIRSQISQADKIVRADFHIVNEGGLEELEEQAGRVWRELERILRDREGGRI